MRMGREGKRGAQEGTRTPTFLREADFKFTAVGSQGFLPALICTGTRSQINFLGVSRVCVNSPERTRIADIKDTLKDPQTHDGIIISEGVSHPGSAGEPWTG